MATTIITKNGSGAPLASDLVAGELAVDLTNGRLYTEDSGGSVIELGLTPSGNVDINGGAIDGTTVGAASASTGAFTTLTASSSLNIASSTTVDGVLDEDNMASDSASKLATQQSIKAYVDSQIGANNELSEVLSNGNTTGGTDISVSSGDDITFADSSKAIFGDESDLQIYHDGTNNYVDAAGVGHLYLQSQGDDKDVKIRSDDGLGGLTEYFRADGSLGQAQLYYYGDKKLNTTSTGIDVTGTTSADKVLVSKDGTDHIEVVDASSGQVTNLTTGNTVGYIAVDPSDSVANSTFAVYVDGSEYLTVDSTGNVGVGITTPARLLDLETTTANESYLRISGSAGNVADTNFAGIEFYNLDSSAAGPNVASFIEARAETSTGAGGELVFATLPSTASEGARAIERLRIDADGNVGIGTTSPSNALEVVGNAGNTVARFYNLAAATSLLQFQDTGTTTRPRIGSVGNDLILDTANTERLRIDASGNLLVGCTSQPDASNFGGFINPVGQFRSSRNSTSAATQFSFNNPNGEVGTIVTSGSATAYNTSSDQRLKENIVDAPSASDDIDAIQVRSFDWKADGSHQKYGMVAQELQTVAPEAVSAPDDPEKMMGVDYSKLVPMLIKEVQQLRARVAQLEGAN